MPLKKGPAKVSVATGAPAGTDEGDTEVIQFGAVIVKAAVFDCTPEGFTMATCAVPGVVSRVAGTGATTCVGWTLLDGRLVCTPFGAVHMIDDPVTKFCPVMKINKPGPVATLLGVIDVINGGGGSGLVVEI